MGLTHRARPGRHDVLQDKAALHLEASPAQCHGRHSLEVNSRIRRGGFGAACAASLPPELGATRANHTLHAGCLTHCPRDPASQGASTAPYHLSESMKRSRTAHAYAGPSRAWAHDHQRRGAGQRSSPIPIQRVSGSTPAARGREYRSRQGRRGDRPSWRASPRRSA